MATVKLPTPSELTAVGKQLGTNLSDDDVSFCAKRGSARRERGRD